jgi:hypothetical protein
MSQERDPRRLNKALSLRSADEETNEACQPAAMKRFLP